ncbi:class II aldolase/adducin family protein [Roseiarcaceae bacterium H3SJ34-1]|uniref:class II aldolase/adducin family protein n=1 Tax=Terripilifer ovatus TaxID=3032367 RepID=UPI003AB96699|nr:class II aldolase/adducin family protein [Roseiarcaceae bacterium H3SJ34-1]
MNDALEIAKIDLVIANRVMAKCGAVDAYGHVSVRHPLIHDRLLISRSLSPELVERDDIMEFTLDRKTVNSDNRPAYRELVIHSEVYRARPDVNAVVHGHPRQILPFTVSETRLRPVYFGANECGADIPVWDIRDKFGDTNVLVITEDHGREMAAALGGNSVVLLRGHGMVGAARSAMKLVRVAKSLLTNAEMYLDALRLGPVKEMTPGELAARDATVGNDDMAPSTMRGWEYEAITVGCGDLLQERAERYKRLQAAAA